MTTKRKIPENCCGCFTNDTTTCIYMYQYWRRNTTECPCGTCLVKAVCNNSCEEYDKFWMGMDAAVYFKNKKASG